MEKIQELLPREKNSGINMGRTGLPRG